MLMKVFPLLALLFASVSTPSPGPGISEVLANDRAGAVASLSYDLSFRIPQSKDEPIRGSEVVHFRLSAPRRIFLDFEQPRDHVLAVRVSGHPIAFAFLDGHLITPPSV